MSDASMPEFVRAVFDWSLARENEAELDASVSRCIHRFFGSPSTNSATGLDALSADFSAFEIPSDPQGVGAYVEEVSTRLVDHSVHVSSPTFIGHMTSALPYFVRPMSRLLTALNQNLVKVETAKAFTPYERQALGMLHHLIYGCEPAFYQQHLQDHESTLGVMTSGGTLANITALWIARNRSLSPADGGAGVDRAGLVDAMSRAGRKRAVIVGSALMHYSLEKAADVLGVGTEAFERVPVDERGRVIPSALRDRVREVQDRGDHILAIVGIGGTTDCGAIDPLDEIGAIARDARAHFHVDAAWGGPLIFSDKYRDRLRGIELADSVTIDGHKQLYLPMGIGMVILRDPRAAVSIEKQAQYIIRKGSADLGRRALEGSRPGMALYLHAALHVLGKKGYGFLIEEGVRKAEVMAELIERSESFELFGAPDLNILNYRYVPAALRAKARSATLTTEEQERINRLNEQLQGVQWTSGRSFVSRTTLRMTRHGADVPVVALRAVLANPLTTDEDVVAVLREQGEVAAELEGEL